MRSKKRIFPELIVHVSLVRNTTNDNSLSLKNSRRMKFIYVVQRTVTKLA